MLLKDLANEYRESAAMLTERIKKLTEQIADKNICEMEKMRLRRRADILRTMYYETLKTAKYLEGYYAGEDA
ncbi:MAG: hypothetical protein IJ017_01565 [Oscillospiraceae bacterium]|nr:hypothetical protein [Oscillospiraceae bacterium]